MVKKGDIISFGRYFYDSAFEKQPIPWSALKIEEDRLLLVSAYILDAHKFDSGINDYEYSEIRTFLNGYFYDTAFDESEKQRIIRSEIDNSTNSIGDNTNPYSCPNTFDKVFLLSCKEAEELFPSAEARRKIPTPYAAARDMYVDEYSGVGRWWLRSPCEVGRDYAFETDDDGDIDFGVCVRARRGVVPAIYLSIK